MECRGGLTMEEGAMMTMTKLMSVPSGGVGKGDGDCDSNGDGDSDSGGDTFNNQKMLQATMECRGGLTVEKGAMMTTMELTNIPLGGVGKGDGNCNGNSDGNSDVAAMQQSANAAGGNGMEGGGYHGGGGNDDDDRIEERPIWAAMAMAMVSNAKYRHYTNNRKMLLDLMSRITMGFGL